MRKERNVRQSNNNSAGCNISGTNKGLEIKFTRAFVET